MLQYCPKLVQLDITLDNGSSVTFNMYHNHGYPTLRHLHASYEAANSAIVPRIIQHFTCLDVLRLTTPMISYEDLSKVSQLCPQLQRLLLGNRNGTPHTENALLQQGDSRGIRLLFIQSSLFHGDCIARFLKEHATRLESVEVLLSASSISYISSLLHEPVVLDRLRSLRYLSHLGQHAMHLIDWIVLHAPHIEFVEAIYGSVKGRTLHALIDRPVKRINLELSASSRDMGQYEFVHHHVTLGVHSSLQDIKCTIDTAFMGSRDWLHLIADLQQLTSLEICLQYGGDTSSLVNLLARLSLGCTSLENVTLTFFSFSPPGEWIQPLSQHPRLKSLVIVCNMMAEGMLPVLKEFRHLDLLQLKLKTFDLKTIAQLKSEIPCLVFTTQSAHQ